MKRIISLILMLLLLSSIPALADESLGATAEAIKNATTPDEQLAQLYDLSVIHAAAFENGEWDVDLDFDPAGELPEAFIPDVENAVKSDGMPETLRDAKFIVLCDAFRTDGSFAGRSFLGGFYAHLPETNRARSLEDANAVLYVVQDYHKRGDYIGEAYNRVYTLYAAALDGRQVFQVDATATTPPYSGIGPLAGERLSAQELWKRFEAAIFNVPLVMEYPEGTATFRITEGGCCMTGLEGTFTRFEVPQEVDGRRVVGIEKIKQSSLEELILPEGLEWINGRNAIECQFLQHIQFPSTLKRINGEDVFWYSPWPGHPLDTLEFNEGLEEIGEDSLTGSRSIKSITLPSTLRQLGTGFLKNGLGCSWVALPEGLENMPGQFLSTPRYVRCVYLPASISSFAYNALTEDVQIYTPAGSPASEWAEERGFSWFSCDSAEDMPKPAIERDGDYEYMVLDGEAELLRYYGSDEEITVPDTLGGFPVRIICDYAFTSFDENHYSNRVRVLRLPDTVRQLKTPCVDDADYLEALYIPVSVEKCEGMIVRDCPKCTVYSPAKSPARAACEAGGISWEEYQ